MIDLRSDWVAAPTEQMWAAMRAAGEESLAQLEGLAARALGKEASLWLPTCSMANLVALLTLCEPGARVALGPETHILTTEAMGIEHVAGLEPVELGAPAELVCLENTHTRRGGTTLSVEETSRLAALAPKVHLDGARLPNAAVALGVTMAELAAPADTVALSLNKGLGAPVGAVLAGEAGVIALARERARRIGGASVHKAGYLAAAGLVALGLVEGLAEDHRRARELAERLEAIEGVSVEYGGTNIVFFSAEGRGTPFVIARLAERGVLGYLRDERRIRFVTHRQVDDESLEGAANAVMRLV